MGTPRLSEPVDQMRNVQRTASCGGEIVRGDARETERCRSNENQFGTIEVSVAMQATLSSELSFVSGCEIGAACFFEVAQQVLFAQQAGLQAFPTLVSETMQERTEP